LQNSSCAAKREHIEPQQSVGYEPDSWEEQIGDFLASATRVTVGVIARDGLHMAVERVSTTVLQFGYATGWPIIGSIELQ
jgi:hypothetical protein